MMPVARRSWGNALRAAGSTMALIAAAAIATPAAGDEDGHQKISPDEAVASMEALLARLARDFPGRVLTVDLEGENDAGSGWVYEAKVLTADGDVLEVELDAVSLELLEVEGGERRRADD